MLRDVGQHDGLQRRRYGQLQRRELYGSVLDTEPESIDQQRSCRQRSALDQQRCLRYYSDTYTNSYTNSYANSYTNPDSYTNPNAYSDSNTNAYSNMQGMGRQHSIQSWRCREL